jgi:hypothetical protein
MFLGLLTRYTESSAMAQERPLEESKMRFRSVVSVIVAIVGTAVSATWILATQLASIHKSIDDTASTTRALAASIDEVRVNSYTLSRASEVALRQAIAEPGRPVVDPRDPSKTIVVKEGTHSDGALGAIR